VARLSTPHAALPARTPRTRTHRRPRLPRARACRRACRAGGVRDHLRRRGARARTCLGRAPGRLGAGRPAPTPRRALVARGRGRPSGRRPAPTAAPPAPAAAAGSPARRAPGQGRGVQDTALAGPRPPRRRAPETIAARAYAGRPPRTMPDPILDDLNPEQQQAV